MNQRFKWPSLVNNHHGWSRRESGWPVERFKSFKLQTDVLCWDPTGIPQSDKWTVSGGNCTVYRNHASWRIWIASIFVQKLSSRNYFCFRKMRNYLSAYRHTRISGDLLIKAFLNVTEMLIWSQIGNGQKVGLSLFQRVVWLILTEFLSNL